MSSAIFLAAIRVCRALSAAFRLGREDVGAGAGAVGSVGQTSADEEGGKGGGTAAPVSIESVESKSVEPESVEPAEEATWATAGAC